MSTKNWKAAYNSPARRKARHKASLRKKRLASPITPQDVTTFTKHLLAVSYGASECWFFVPTGRRQVMPEDLGFSTVSYATATCNGEQVNAHRFALAAHLGVSYSSLDGWDVHHTKGCIGYRCQNPEHLEKTPMREHRASRGVSGSLIRYQVKLMELALHQPVRGGAERCLAGVQFNIRRGVVDSIIRQEWSTPTFQAVGEWDTPSFQVVSG